MASETIISDAVARETREIVTCEPAGSVQAKGFDHDVAAWRVTGRAQSNLSTQAPIVGRREERDLFAGCVATLETQCNGAAICLRGEPGIGKTRLLDAFEETAHSAGITCQSALVLDFGGSQDQGAVTALTTSMVTALTTSGDDAVSQLVARGTIGTDQVAHLTILLGQTPSETQRSQLATLSSDEHQNAAVAAFRCLVEAFCETTPLLICIEDIHWADANTLAIVAMLAQCAANLPLIVIVSTRIEGYPFADQPEVATHFTVLNVNQLQPGDATNLAARYPDLDTEQIKACIERADGHPLFLDQLLRNASETGTESLPGTLQSVVAARMDALPSRDRRALQVASILGQRFDLDALRYLLDDTTYAASTLLDHGLLRPLGSLLLFAHALVRESVLSSLLRTDRHALHKRAAEWFAGRDLTAHAEHLELAGASEAPDAYQRAGEEAAAGYRYDEALGLARRALAIDNEHVDALCLAAGMQRVLGEVTASVGMFARARELPLIRAVSTALQ
ncbi:MAG: AAA family ATPase [Alphaproteobacteria bacterium]|nr:AAA family ATPase [Rhodospirillaceae bacterium]MBT7613851.1 AAA family ATPase [Rhodospirillaceae bacterium]MDG2480800.1 AAA family ATPase [Alphaproteobacteria bacterium]